MLGNIYIFAVMVLMFGACIFVHELGHFLVAAWRGLRAERFSIGFGPKIWGKTYEWTDRRGKSQKTEFCVCWFPFGGYVVLPQISPLDEKHLAEYDPPLASVAPLDKILTAVAGPIFNVVFGFVIATIVMAVGIPMDKSEHDLTLAYVPENSIEYQAGIRSGDKIVAINNTGVNNWMEIDQAVVFTLSRDVRVSVVRGGNRMSFTLQPDNEPILNLRSLSVGPRTTVQIQKVYPSSPAEQAGLAKGDKVLEMDGIEVLGPSHLVSLVATRAGQPTRFLVQRGGEKLTLTVTPGTEKKTGRGMIGIAQAGISEAGKITVHPTPMTQVKQVILLMGKTITALLHPRQTGVSPGDLQGPVGIGQMLWYSIKEGLVFALSFMVILNINLAVLNLLPVPVLDGGHVMFALLESARKRPLSFRVASTIQSAFAALLISFILYVTYNDILRLFRINRLRSDRSDKMEFVEPASPQHLPTPPLEPATP